MANIFTSPENITISPWLDSGSGNTTRTGNYAPAPDSTNTADRIVGEVNKSAGIRILNFGSLITEGQILNIMHFVKLNSSTATWSIGIEAAFNDPVTSTWTPEYTWEVRNMSNETLYSGTGDFFVSPLQAEGYLSQSEWRAIRVSTTETYPGVATNQFSVRWLTDATSPDYGDILAWGFQGSSGTFDSYVSASNWVFPPVGATNGDLLGRSLLGGGIIR